MESTTLTFKVTRQNPELIPPAKPTPHQFKLLSDIDDQENFRYQFSAMQFYRKNPAMEGKDPAKFLRDAIAKALVFFYPFAGRLREYDGRKLVVECTGEGILFIEAEADVTLEEFGGALYPPFPNVEELLYDVPGSGGLLNSPLLFFQVTPLKCNGFIFAARFNHTMCDAAGFFQFLFAVSELARGAEVPSIQPVWQRHLLNARCPPRVSYTHHEYDVVPDPNEALTPQDNLVQLSFFFDATDILALRHSKPPHLHNCSKFELLTACIWRCRTIAVSQNPNEKIRIICVVNVKKRFNPPLPEGYYGNAIVLPTAISTAEKLSRNPLSYALKLVRKAKSEATEEYVKSVADLMVIRGRPNFTLARTYLVSDLTNAGFRNIDYGWGKAAYAGPATGGSVPHVASFFIAIKNNQGEEGVLVPISLPRNAMDIFTKELEMMIMTARKNLVSNASAL